MAIAVRDDSAPLAATTVAPRVAVFSTTGLVNATAILYGALLYELTPYPW